MKKITVVICICALATAAGAQVSSPPPPRAQAAGVAVPQPVILDLTPLLAPLQQAVQNINLDVARLRIEKWKADTAVRQQTQQNADSVARNVTAALPGMIDQLRANPQSLAASVKLYRNVNALYDVFSGLAESAGAFGSRNEYQALAADAGKLDDVRRAMGERLENMASSTDAEMTRLRTQIVQAKAAAAAAPPKKIVVDEDEKPKKPARKKPVPKQPASQPQ